MNITTEILAIDKEMELLNEIRSTQRNCPLMGRKKDLLAKRARLIVAARQQATFLRLSHPSRF